MEIASKGQLRLSFLRWAIVTIPAILLLGFLSSSLAPSGSENRWYQALIKPEGTPPEWVFPVAWTTLYVLLGLALAIVIHARGARTRGIAIALFVLQMLLNFAWTPIFFGMHLVDTAFGVIVAMFALALAATLLFGRIRPVAAWLMVPYLAWLCYAGALTYRIDQLNPNAGTLVPSASSTQIEL